MRSLTTAQSGLQALLYLASRGCSIVSVSKLSLFLAAFKLGIGA